jgi:hypothetical protein
MVGLLVGRHRQRGPINKKPRRLADRGLVYELFQALVGAVLPDDDDYDASLLNSLTSHTAHAIIRGFHTQGDHKSDCTYPGSVRVSVFVVDDSFHVSQLLSEQISYIGYPAIINAKFTPEIKGLSILLPFVYPISLISYIQYTSTVDTLLCAELN